MSDEVVYLLGWIGMYAPMALGAIGSMVGCAIAGQTACGAMLDVESGYGRFIGVSAMPSSQTIYGIVVMFTLQAAAAAGGRWAIDFERPERGWHFQHRGVVGPGVVGQRLLPRTVFVVLHQRQQEQARNLRSLNRAGSDH